MSSTRKNPELSPEEEALKKRIRRMSEILAKGAVRAARAAAAQKRKEREAAG